jgi:hypothetical protein
MSFNFTGDQALVHSQILAVGETVAIEGTATTVKGVVNRKMDDIAREFEAEVGETGGSGGALAMLSFSYVAEPYIKAGQYIAYDGLRAVIKQVKPRRYSGILVRIRCLVEERAA